MQQGLASMDRRHFTRVQVRSAAVVKSRFIEINGEVQDLSINGIRLKSNQKFDLGKEVQVRISFSTDSSQLWINLFGIVIRHESNGMAIQFSNIPLDSYVHLRNMICCFLDDQYKVIGESFIHMTEGCAKGPYPQLEFEKSFSVRIDEQLVPQ